MKLLKKEKLLKIINNLDDNILEKDISKLFEEYGDDAYYENGYGWEVVKKGKNYEVTSELNNCTCYFNGNRIGYVNSITYGV